MNHTAFSSRIAHPQSIFVAAGSRSAEDFQTYCVEPAFSSLPGARISLKSANPPTVDVKFLSKGTGEDLTIRLVNTKNDEVRVYTGNVPTSSDYFFVMPKVLGMTPAQQNRIRKYVSQRFRYPPLKENPERDSLEVGFPLKETISDFENFARELAGHAFADAAKALPFFSKNLSLAIAELRSIVKALKALSASMLSPIKTPSKRPSSTPEVNSPSKKGAGRPQFGPLYALSNPLAKTMFKALAATYDYVQADDDQSDAAATRFENASGATEVALNKLKKALMSLLSGAGVDTNSLDPIEDFDHGSHDMYGVVKLEGQVNGKEFLVQFDLSVDGGYPATLALSFHFGQVETTLSFEGEPKKLGEARIKKFFDESFKFFEKNGVSGKKATLEF